MSLVILTNIPTPYRTAFFDALAEVAARAGLCSYRVRLGVAQLKRRGNGSP